MFMNKMLLAISVLVIFSCATQTPAGSDKVVAVLAAASMPEDTLEKANQSMAALYDVYENSNTVDRDLVSLLDYYIGSANGAILAEFVSKRGSSILPLLQEKLDSPLTCEARFEAICAESKEQRDKRIRYLIDAIESGSVLCVDESSCD